MLNRKRCAPFAVTAFLIAELVLGILVQTAPAPLVRWVSFGCVLLACLFVSLFFEKSEDYVLTQVGLICTVCADIFLVVMDPIKQLPAMVFFSVVQMCYFARLYLKHTSKKQRLVHLILRGAATAVSLGATVIVLGKNTDVLSLVSLFYYEILS